MKNKYYYLFIKNNFDYLLILMLCYLVKGNQKTKNQQPKTNNRQPNQYYSYANKT